MYLKRPAYHFIAPQGWINDPCAPGYDAKTGLFHLFYQWNPKSYQWGDISWGHATSKDLLSWEHAQEPPLKPGLPYDNLGAFTGCFYPTGPRGEADQLCIFYTNVSYLPFHWTQEYIRGSEGISLAVSKDGGKSWTKSPSNPILKEEPPDLDVSGFRDPCVTTSRLLSQRYSDPVDTLYGIIAGGVQEHGPNLFIYRISASNLAEWTYLGCLFDPPLKGKRKRWMGDLGRNWECPSIFELPVDGRGEQQSVVLVGSEGGLEPARVAKWKLDHPGAPERGVRFNNWLFCDPDSTVRTRGLLDWGLFYATSTFLHPDGRRIAWGWIPEEDISDELRKARGWTGCFGVPREIFIQSLPAASGYMSPLADMPSIDVRDGGAYTLGCRPIRELEQLRTRQVCRFFTTRSSLPEMDWHELPLASEIRLRARILQQSNKVSLIVRASQDRSVFTSIDYYPRDEKIVVDRSHSSRLDGVNTMPEEADFTLFNLRAGERVVEHQGDRQRLIPAEWRTDSSNMPSDMSTDCVSEAGRTSLELYELAVFLDGHVLEVFANDRCCISTLIYTEEQHTSMTVECDGETSIELVEAWEISGR